MEKTKENFRWERPKRNEMIDLGEIQLISKRGPIHFLYLESSSTHKS